ncbi:MAG: SDR family NAD(P)-dependent oxidoreductase, partial [Thermoanaerobaculia bacterium]
MKTAVVTGGSRGIGLAISQALAAAGRRVVLTCREDIERAEQAASGIRAAGGEAIAVRADVTKAGEVKALGERIAKDFGACDIL